MEEGYGKGDRNSKNDLKAKVESRYMRYFYTLYIAKKEINLEKVVGKKKLSNINFDYKSNMN